MASYFDAITIYSLYALTFQIPRDFLRYCEQRCSQPCSIVSADGQALLGDIRWKSHDHNQISWIYEPWASYQIRKIAGCACAGNAGNVFPDAEFKGKRDLAIPACMCRDACRDCLPRWRGKRSRHSWRMRTRNYTYFATGPCEWFISNMLISSMLIDMGLLFKLMLIHRKYRGIFLSNFRWISICFMPEDPLCVISLDTITIHILSSLDVHAEYFYPLSNWNGDQCFCI